MSIAFTDGMLILVESDKKGLWWEALPWQSEQFIKAMKFGTMKSMCIPNPLTQTETFTQDGMKYHFLIENDWGPCTLVNETTNKKRLIKYFEISKPEHINYDDIKPSQIVIP